MWSRVDLKERAKSSLSRNYWIFVAAALLLMLFGQQSFDFNFEVNDGGSSFSVDGLKLYESSHHGQEMYDEFGELYIQDSVDTAGNYIERMIQIMNGNLLAGIFAGVFAMAAAIVAALAFVFKIFVSGPLEVGVDRTFLKGQYGRTQAGTIGYGFTNGHYMNVVGIQFCRSLFTFLWTLLFVIPGIVKSYEYRMIPYILSQNPGIDRKRAFEMSKDMMMGNKMDAFILDLSFLGWHILSALTLNILGIFYVNPYVNATNAQLYGVLRQRNIENGHISEYEVPDADFYDDYIV